MVCGKFDLILFWITVLTFLLIIMICCCQVVLFVFNTFTRKKPVIQREKIVCVKFDLIFLSLLHCCISLRFDDNASVIGKKGQVKFVLLYIEREHFSFLSYFAVLCCTLSVIFIFNVFRGKQPDIQLQKIFCVKFDLIF